MLLKSRDIVIALKLVSMQGEKWTYESLAKSLDISRSSVFEGISRAVNSHLIEAATKKPRRRALAEFLVHGLKYVFPPKRGSLVWGIPTGYAAAPLKGEIVQTSEAPPVWPFKVGETRGYSFLPLDECVASAAEKDKNLYELLALVDAIRGGRSRESNLASILLQERLGIKTSEKAQRK